MNIHIKLTEPGDAGDIFIVDTGTGLATKLTLGLAVSESTPPPTSQHVPAPQVPISKEERERRREAADKAAGLID